MVIHFPELRCPVCRCPADQVVESAGGSYYDVCLEHTDEVSGWE